MKIRFFLSLASFLVVSIYLYSQPTPQLPPVVNPGQKNLAPSDAIVLFSKNSLDAFESVDGGSAEWTVKGKKFSVNPGTGNIQTKEPFGDCQLHIEWMTPKKDVKEGKAGQQNGNSGIYLMGKYEVQVLNSFINETDADRQAASIYHQHVPLVNASLPPGKWQTYDIIFTAPDYDASGNLVKSGLITVFHNGLLVQYNAEIKTPTQAASTQFTLEKSELPLMLQDHTNEVSYRNIWIRKL